MKKVFIFVFVFILAVCLVSVPTLAVTEDEVQEQIDKVGKDAVTGNILVWFLCAIGFLKVSQKIDSFMSAIGINVGNTGGSMLTEGLLAIRGAGIAKSFLGGKGLGGGGGGKGIINNCKTKIVLNLEDEEAQRVQSILNLSEAEIMEITHFERGNGLISTNNNNITVEFKCSDLEKSLITTDRREFKEILNNMQN